MIQPGATEPPAIPTWSPVHCARMNRRSFTLDKLDIPAFAVAGASLQGSLVLERLPRLRESLHPERAMDAPDTTVTWQVRGEARSRPGGAPGLWMHLQAHTVALLTCQRCLRRVDEPLAVDHWFHFVDNETLAAELDAESEEEDVLVISRSFDLPELIEDELLLALPLAPCHVVCPELPRLPVDVTVDELQADPAADVTDGAKRRPLAGLADLKRKLGSDA